MSESIKDRIEKIRAFYGLGANKFEAVCDLSHGYLSKLKSDVGSSKLENIISAFPDINPLWLLTGDGGMLKSKDPVTTIQITDSPQANSEIVIDGGDFVSGTGDSDTIKRLLDLLAEKDRQIQTLLDLLKK